MDKVFDRLSVAICMLALLYVLWHLVRAGWL